MTIQAIALFFVACSVLPFNSVQAVTDIEVLNFALNLEYLEATFYSFAAYGYGIPKIYLGGGPAPTGNLKGLHAKLSPEALAVAVNLATDELKHVIFLRKALGKYAVAAPAINVGTAFAAAANAAFGTSLSPSFSPYASDVLFYHGAFIFEDVGVTAYKGAAGLISSKAYLEAAAGILAVEAYHAGYIRSLLVSIKDQYVFPYGVQVKTIVGAISNLRATVSKANDDKGIVSGSSIVIAPTDANAIAFSRNTTQVLAIVYLGGKTKGGFFPNGLNGSIK